jgi:lathosterol oxidase
MIFFHILSYDIWFYISHIALHQPYLYRTIHRIHHDVAYEEMTFMDAHRAHFLESLFQCVGILFPLFFVPFSWKPFCMASLFVCIRGCMRHDHRCSCIIGSHHLLHHKNPRINYGEAWIDRMLSTHNGQE